MHKERIWTLMSRKLSGEATTAEISELDELLQIHSDVDLPSQMVQAFWHMPTSTDEEEFLEATFHLHTEILQKKGFHFNSNCIETGSFTLENHQNLRKKRRLLFVATISIFIIALAAGLTYFKVGSANTVTNNISKSEVSTKKGSRTKVQLPDGTTVWLNSSSKLTYDNQNFGNVIREVTLSGEAYFDVVKNKAKPFIIHTAKMDIKVLGTVFNVKCYPGEKTTETSLIRGSVEVTLNDRKEKIMLKPSEKLIFNTLQNKSEKINAAKQHLKMVEKEKPIIELGHLTIYPIDSSIVETAWMENKLVFTNESLEDIALKMERWYGIPIIIRTESLKKELITGSFEKETIYQALKALQFTNKFTYTTEKEKIIISK